MEGLEVTEPEALWPRNSPPFLADTASLNVPFGLNPKPYINPINPFYPIYPINPINPKYPIYPINPINRGFRSAVFGLGS